MNKIHDDFWYSPDAESGTLGDRKLGYTVWAQPITQSQNVMHLELYSTSVRELWVIIMQ